MKLNAKYLQRVNQSEDVILHFNFFYLACMRTKKEEIKINSFKNKMFI